jgi:hypothetical protein
MSILTASEGVADCILLSSEGDNDLAVSKHKLHSMEDFKQDIKYPLCSLQGFTTSFADGDSEKPNMQVHFNTDSVFLFATTQPLDTFAVTFANSSLDLFIKPTNV